MYNAEQKSAFLNTIDNDNSYKAYKKCFNAIEKLEERFGKDISNMSVEELLIVIDACTGTRFSNTNAFISLTKTYVDWCIQSGKTTSENNFDKINRTDVNKSRVYYIKYLKDKQELEDMIGVVFKPDYDYNEDIDMQKELIIRLAYEGMHEKEIVLLKKQDVDFENKTLKSPLYDGVFYKVDDRIMELITFCINQETITTEDTRRGIEKKERLCVNDYVIRKRIAAVRKTSGEEKPNTISVAVKVLVNFLQKYSDATDNYKELSFAKIRESRTFHDIYNSGREESFIENEVRTDIEMKNPGIKPRALNDRVTEVKKTYRAWKEAFNL